MEMEYTVRGSCVIQENTSGKCDVDYQKLLHN